MLPRTARRLELLSRQSLPRPARFIPSRYPYSTPSKPAKFPATATQALPTNEYPAYIPPLPSTSSRPHQDISAFLHRPNHFTILPTPLPKEDQDEDMVFTDTHTQDMLAVMDACLNDLYNVPRARVMFNRIRDEKHFVLNVDIFNRVMEAYFGLAEKDATERVKWLTEGWSLYHEMLDPESTVKPDQRTYACLFDAWAR